jgi:hemolysin III
MDVLALREPASALSHGLGAVLAVPGTLVLWRRSRGDAGKRISLLIYGLGLTFCYAASALYHGVPVSGERLDPFIRLDSIGIFALIAGSYTPLAWSLMRGPWRAWTLALVWGTTLIAIALIASGRHFSPSQGTAIYLGMGWGVVACYAQVARAVSHRALRPVVLGGVYYSVGAVLNVLQRPTLWPGTFGAHDLFHLFVIAGSLAHYLFLLRVVVPFRWPAAVPQTSRPGVKRRSQAIPADGTATVRVA